jgi:hypothetical protein
MLSDLKNAGATYQRTMQKCLADQIGRNIDVNVDDIAVMSKKQDGLIADLQETFDNLRKYNMMLKLTKCLLPFKHGDRSWVQVTGCLLLLFPRPPACPRFL